MDLVLIRHALPFTIVGATGVADPELTPLGLEQAAKVAEWLREEHFDALYTSPLRRARQTAAPMAAQRGIEPIVRAGLAEYDQDSSEYVPLEELKRTNYDAWREVMRTGAYGANDPVAFQSTVVSAINEIIDENPRRRVALVCHGGVINVWTAHVLGMPTPFFFQPGYTSVSRFAAARSGERTLLSLNETAHLR